MRIGQDWAIEKNWKGADCSNPNSFPEILVVRCLDLKVSSSSSFNSVRKSSMIGPIHDIKQELRVEILMLLIEGVAGRNGDLQNVYNGQPSALQSFFSWQRYIVARNGMWE